MLSAIQSDLLKRMKPLDSSGGSEYCTSICFAPDFAGFEGHFPGHPIVPAVCLLSLVELIGREIAGNQSLRISDIISMKFKMPLMSNDIAAVKATATSAADGSLVVNATVSKDATAWAAKIKIALK